MKRSLASTSSDAKQEKWSTKLTRNGWSSMIESTKPWRGLTARRRSTEELQSSSVECVRSIRNVLLQGQGQGWWTKQRNNMHSRVQERLGSTSGSRVELTLSELWTWLIMASLTNTYTQWTCWEKKTPRMLQLLYAPMSVIFPENNGRSNVINVRTKLTVLRHMSLHFLHSISYTGNIGVVNGCSCHATHIW